VLTAGALRGLKWSASDARLPNFVTVIEQKKQWHIDMLRKKHEEWIDKVQKQRKKRKLKEDKMILREDAETAAKRVEYKRETEKCWAMTNAEFLEMCRTRNKEKHASIFEQLQLHKEEMRREAEEMRFKGEEMRFKGEEMRRKEASARREAEYLELIETLQAMSQ
jgi:hypothetical protein